MLFDQFAKVLEQLEKTASRLSITAIYADLLNKAKADEVASVVYLSLGGLAASYKSIVFNVADKMLIKALAEAYKKTISEVTKLYKRLGDLGDVAYQLASSTGLPRKITVSQVHQELVHIAQDEGASSQERKTLRLAKLLQSLSGLSAKYVARITLGKLRLGFSDLTVIDALSWMVAGDKSKSQDIKRVYEVLPDVGKIAQDIKTKGCENAIKNTTPQVGVPVLPMLAQRLKDPKDMIAKMGKVAVEPKLDGLRILIHFDRKTNLIKAFTRNLNETSWMFPELAAIAKYVKGNSLIIDGEAVGLDEATKKMANFQTTMTRRRKHNIEASASKTSIVFHIFDVLSHNGQNFMSMPYKARRQELSNIIIEGQLFKLVESLETDSPEYIADRNKLLKDRGYEGVIVKKLEGKYVPGRTGWNWVKMKENVGSIAKLVDTIDCVVMGYTRGKGKRAAFGVGQFLAGVVIGEKIKTVTKVGTGLTDEQFRDLNKRLEKLRTTTKPKEYDVPNDLVPDVWVLPSLVVELAADEVTKSPKHTSGFALRFPRLVKFRDDKKYFQATSVAEIKEIASG